MNSESRLALPGRSVDELLGPLTRRDERPHLCVGNHCRDEAHRPRRPGEQLYVWDRRADSPWRARHEDGARVTFWASEPHPDVRRVWEERVGPWNDPEYGPSSFEAIPWKDGHVLLLLTARNVIFDLWLTVEEVTA